jgi:CBS domain containing-hemolysin-like protein
VSAVLVILLVAAAAVLLAVGGLLAAADAALSVRSRAQLITLADELPRGGKSLRAIAEDEPSHINALNFGRVIAETLAAVLVTVVLAYTIEELWVTLALATLIMTAVTYVLVGSSPRSIGTHRPDKTLRVTAPTVRAMRVLLGPISSGLIRLGDLVTPARGTGSARIRDEQQLLSMVDHAAEQELLEEDDRDFIHSIVAFGETLVREVMVPRTDMVTIDGTETVREAFERLLISRHSRIPVVTGDVDDVVGVAYLRDIAAFVLRRPDEAADTPVSRIMKPAVFVPDLQRGDDLLRQMQREANHLALVVDEYGGIAGLVTLEDLIEELVGDISDEHDREQPDAQLEGPGVFRVNARLPVDELGELFGIELEDDDVESVGGLVAKELGRLAEPGDTVRVSGIELTALDTERKRQRLVTVRARWVGDDQFNGGTLKVLSDLEE